MCALGMLSYGLATANPVLVRHALANEVNAHEESDENEHIADNAELCVRCGTMWNLINPVLSSLNATTTRHTTIIEIIIITLLNIHHHGGQQGKHQNKDNNVPDPMD